MFTKASSRVNILSAGEAARTGKGGRKTETGMTKKAFLFAAVAALGAAACETPASNQAGADAGPTALQKADPRLGAEVNRICFQRSINSWRTIDGDDDAILLRRGVNDLYRVEYTGNCRSSDFRFAQTIGIVGRPAGGCLTPGDRLLVEGPGDFVNRCLITQINEWDEDAGEEDAADEEGESENED